MKPPLSSHASLSTQKSHRFHLAILSALGVVLCAPLWWLGFPVLADDAKTHIVWYSHFSSQLRAGEVYPRWLPDMNAGLGSPAFFFYQPLVYYLSAIVNVFDSANAPWIALGRSATVALVCSGLTAYAWLQTFVPRRSAAWAAIIYLIGPYHMATDVYLRGAFAELWAFVWLPLVLLFAQLVATPDGLSRLRSLFALAFFYACLVATHPPTALVTAPLIIAHSASTSSTRSVAGSSTRRTTSVVCTIAALIFGLCLTAIYLLPALLLEPFVGMKAMREGVFSYQNSFLTWESARDSLRLQGICLVTMLLAAACCFVIVEKSDNAREVRQAMRFWMAIVLVAALMTTSLSAPIYALLPPLQRIQFPWRWLVIVSVASLPLYAQAFAHWKKPVPRWKTGAKIALALVFLSWLPLQLVFARRSYPQFVADKSYANYVRFYQLNGLDMPGHWPREAANLRADQKKFLAQMGSRAPNYRFAEILDISAKSGSDNIREEVQVFRRSPREYELRFSARQFSQKRARTVRVRQLFFAGWQAVATTEKGARVLDVRPSRGDGLILIDVPADAQTIKLQMRKTAPEIWGARISLVCLALLAALWLWASARKRDTREPRI